MMDIRLIVHDVRSTHNVGSLLRTADGLGVRHVYFTGYTPYPVKENDTRLPHISTKLTKDIHKTALGAEQTVKWSRQDDVVSVIRDLQTDGFTVVALEQTDDAVPLATFEAPPRVALLLGREVEGIEPDLVKLCDSVVAIPMLGSKESFNVVQAAAMALYQFRHLPKPGK
ncbi:TrmH family RNA methyltransferase [Candidatus Saccharibacteria bacterium]|nr:TrmH family RNA methyltransferase [Candidatus Saccharibacteria bacterium]